HQCGAGGLAHPAPVVPDPQRRAGGRQRLSRDLGSDGRDRGPGASGPRGGDHRDPVRLGPRRPLASAPDSSMLEPCVCPSRRRSRPCCPALRMPCPTDRDGSSSPSGTAFARSYSATATRSCCRAATRRERLERGLARAAPPVHLSPATHDRALAEDWFRRFEGAGLDGVMAKRLDAPYRAGERTMIKVKHARTADCVVAGFRWHKKGERTMIGSLLLGLYDADGALHHVGVTAAFTNTARKELVTELAPLREHALEDHPWRDWAEVQEDASATGQRMPGATSRWNRGKDLSW